MPTLELRLLKITIYINKIWIIYNNGYNQIFYRDIFFFKSPVIIQIINRGITIIQLKSVVCATLNKTCDYNNSCEWMSLVTCTVPG